LTDARRGETLHMQHGRDAAMMTREHKLALVIGFALVLVVGVLISDHFSSARLAQLEVVGSVARSSKPLLAPSRPLPDERQRQSFLKAEALEDVPASQINPQPSPRQLADAAQTKPQNPIGNSLESIQEYARAHGLEFQRLTPAAAVMDSNASTGRARMPSTSDTRVRVVVVQEGDSLWKLTSDATGDGHLYKKVAAFNAERLQGSDVVHPGMTILIPSSELLRNSSIRQLVATGRRASATDSNAAPTTRREKSSQDTYTVKAGDVLSVICQRELGTIRRMNDVLALNRDVLRSPNSIRVGMVLKLPERR
jgi:nucleoid-associated protein YgaU